MRYLYSFVFFISFLFSSLVFPASSVYRQAKVPISKRSAALWTLRPSLGPVRRLERFLNHLPRDSHDELYSKIAYAKEFIKRNPNLHNARANRRVLRNAILCLEQINREATALEQQQKFLEVFRSLCGKSLEEENSFSQDFIDRFSEFPPSEIISLHGEHSQDNENGEENSIFLRFDKDGYLVHLSLHGAFLQGEIPSSIGGLTGLEKLELFHGELSGLLPQSMKYLANLTYVDLSDNVLGQGCAKHDEINPKIFAGWKKLRFLNLSENYFRGPIPHTIGEMKKLEKLSLSGWASRSEEEGDFGLQFSGQLPESIFGLSKLKMLNLEDTNFDPLSEADLERLHNRIKNFYPPE